MTDKRTSVMRKITKLLALVNGNTTEAEANSAFAKAQELMIKYNIEMKEVTFKEGQEEKVIVQNVEDINALRSWVKDLGNIIAQNFRCQFAWSCRNRRVTAKFVGYPNDVDVAILTYQATYNYMQKRMDYLEKKMYKQLGTTKGFKPSYTLGFLQGLKDYFREFVASQSKEYGLMVITPNAVILRTKNFKKSSYDLTGGGHAEGYENGYRDGKSFNAGLGSRIEG